MRSRATWVGVPQTAALGCSDAASVNALAAPSTTPVMSVARCITLGSFSTDGASGTFIAWQ